jgi:beta-galactosidase
VRILRNLALLVVLALGLCAGHASAATPASELSANGSVTIKFQPGNTQAPAGVLVSDGSLYSADRGFGWDQDIRAQARDRGDGCTGVALLDRDASRADFIMDLPDGDYVFDVTAGDSQFPGGLAVLADGELALPAMNYAAGKEAVMSVPVASVQGKAHIAFLGGQRGLPNSLISSIKIMPASADPEEWRKVSEAAEAYQKGTRASRADSEARRSRQRLAYRPINLADTGLPRQETALSGKWLFMPSQDMTEPASGLDPKAEDSSWHVLGVPQFWNPIEWWIYNNAGTSHNYVRKEIERCKDFTFDYAGTKSGWYRQWIEVPKSLSGKRLVLKFDAVATIAEVYWNGKRVGSHVGMFGPFEVEVTSCVRFGEKNLLAVLVAAGTLDPKAAKGIAGVAVSVNITKEMLNSLPRGWYKPGMAGVWQPVVLEVTGKDRIAHLYFRPRLDGAAIDTSISRRSAGTLEIRHTLTDAATSKRLAGGAVSCILTSWVKPIKVTSDISGLRPKLWSPEHPNLYLLRTQLLANGKVIDEKITTVGFKTFEARGNRLYLNGKPYFLRGADMPPHGLAPNDKALADKFMKMMHDGNTMATRFHVSPPSKIWMDACDKYGVGASVGENWPWVLMGDTPIPDPKLIQAWKDEWREIVRANRNHPSLMIWTISNESYFEGGRDKDKARSVEKFRIFSDVIKSARALDPDAMVVFHSGYVRSEADYRDVLKPNGLDDGDIDDSHHYWGWYNRSPFHLDVAKDVEKRRFEGRPLISQEASTGYPDQDTGHPTESYIINHSVPQSWVGQYGLYTARPDMFLETHAQITKEYAEKIRRDRNYLSGWMIFANCCWFRDVYDPDRIAPYPVYGEVKKAYEPVLVSLANPNRHFEAGRTFDGDVYVVNDDPDRPKLTNLTLRWRIFGKSFDPGASGVVSVPDCPYDGKTKAAVEFRVPTNLPLDRSNMTLALELRQGDDVISRNDYPLICASPKWYETANQRMIVVETGTETNEYLRGIGINGISTTAIEWTGVPAGSAVVVATSDKSALGSMDAFLDFVRRGGRVLMLSPTLDLIPGLPAGAKTINAEGEFADVLVPALLDGMDPMDMHWWNAAPNDVPRVCVSSYQFPDASGITKLVQHIQPHGYIKRPGQIADLTSWPVFEIAVGEGRVVVSSLLLADDPISKRFTANLIRYLAR